MYIEESIKELSKYASEQCTRVNKLEELFEQSMRILHIQVDDQAETIRRMGKRLMEVQKESKPYFEERITLGDKFHKHPDCDYWHPASRTHEKFNDPCSLCNEADPEHCLMVTLTGCTIKRDATLRTEINRLVKKYQCDFKKEIDYWERIISVTMMRDGLYATIKHYSHLAGFEKMWTTTGMICTSDISTGSDYNPTMIARMFELIKRHGEVKVLLMVCEEYKKVIEEPSKRRPRRPAL